MPAEHVSEGSQIPPSQQGDAPSPHSSQYPRTPEGENVQTSRMPGHAAPAVTHTPASLAPASPWSTQHPLSQRTPPQQGSPGSPQAVHNGSEHRCPGVEHG
jgi:hypothetical protein